MPSSASETPSLTCRTSKVWTVLCGVDLWPSDSDALPFIVGDQSEQRLALRNIAGMVRPGGILIIDHRNYDYILETGRAPQGKNIYYKVTGSRFSLRFSQLQKSRQQKLNVGSEAQSSTWIHLIQAKQLKSHS